MEMVDTDVGTFRLSLGAVADGRISLPLFQILEAGTTSLLRDFLRPMAPSVGLEGWSSSFEDGRTHLRPAAPRQNFLYLSNARNMTHVYSRSLPYFVNQYECFFIKFNP